MNDRSIRSLVRLQHTASTSRVLNLNLLNKRHEGDEAYDRAPFFRNPSLNRAIIVKHRLRAHEQDLFSNYRSRATKLILPLDGTDLKSGGRYAFLGQRGFEAIMDEILGGGVHALEDRRTLEVLDETPSFDPFLLREFLRRSGLAPAACYFDISPADLQRMLSFLESELRPLVQMSLTAKDERLTASTAKMIEKILSNTAGAELEPLGQTLRLTPSQYAEGVFCWKGFLYYKWRLGQLSADAPVLIDSIRAARPLGARSDPETRAYIAGAKDRIADAVMINCRAVSELLKVYDGAYAKLTGSGDPTAFRDFLLQAPGMFVRLGELLGTIDHVHGFWTFRFPRGVKGDILADELADVFLDFEESLGCAELARQVYIAS